MGVTRKKYIGVGIIITIFLVGLIGYGLGYRLQKNFTLTKVGVLQMTIPLKDTSIFIDVSKKITTTEENEIVKIKLYPETHEIIVSRDLYYPWKKKFVMQSGKSIAISPIFVSSNPAGFIIGNENPEYFKIRNLISKNVLPTKNIPLISKDFDTTVWVEDNTLKAKVGENEISVIKPVKPIRNIDFYKDRTDTFIFSSDMGVYIIDIGEEGNQNFMPVYKGVKPSFVKNDMNSIYVEDGNNLMQVAI